MERLDESHQGWGLNMAGQSVRHTATGVMVWYPGGAEFTFGIMVRFLGGCRFECRSPIISTDCSEVEFYEL